jgi:hypothetical protein
MAQTTTQISKKQAPPVRRPTIEKPQRDLTPTQEEMADLASDLIMNGGSRQDLDPFVRVLLRHQFRKFICAQDTSEATVNEYANRWFEQHSVRLVKQWSDPIKRPTADDTKPKTVAELARANVRHELRDHFEDFFADARDGVEPLWMLNEILTYCTDTGYDLVKAFTAALDLDDTYVRVPWSQADKVRAFVKLIEEREAD